MILTAPGGINETKHILKKQTKETKETSNFFHTQKMKKNGVHPAERELIRRLFGLEVKPWDGRQTRRWLSN